jgi:hypothetical protein
MLGYTEEDVYRMMAAINIARNVYLPDNTSNSEIFQGLQDAYDLLDGLLVEGRI